MWGLLFDLDGTLALTNDWHEIAWREVLQEMGVSLSPHGYATEISGRSNVEIVGRLLPNLSRERAALVWTDKEQRFRRRARGLKAIPGLHELLNWAVSQRGKLAVVTNAPRANAEHILQDLGIASSFECLIAVEDVVHPKPAPEPYLLAVSRLGLMRDNCVAFEDSPSGVKSAVAAGLVVVGLLTGHSEQELRDAGARLIVDDFSSPLVREMLGGVPR